MLLEEHKPAPVAQGGEPAPGGTLKAAAGRHSRRLLTLATVVITLGFSYFALKGIDYKDAWKELQSSDLWWLIPAMIAFGLGCVARALRWRSLFRPARRPPRSTTTNAMMIGYFYNSILPLRGGEPARVLVLTQRSSAPPVEITGTVVLERLYDVVAILLIFFVAEPFLPGVSWFGTAALVAAALAVAISVAAVVLVVFEDRPVRLLLRPLRRFSHFSGDRLEHSVEELVHGLSGLHDWRVALEALAWTVVAWMLSVLSAYLVIVACHVPVPFGAAVLVQVAIGLAMILPSPPAAVGVFEGATLIALQAYGIPHSVALPYAILLHLVNFVPFIVVGAVLLHYNTRHPVAAARTTAVPAGS